MFYRMFIRKRLSAIIKEFFSEVKGMKKSLFWVFFVQITILLFAFILGLQRDNLDKHFGEAGFVTTLSFLNLLFVSYVFAIVFNNILSSSKDKKISAKKIFAHSSIWLALTIGFLYLSFDEILMIHEKTGKAFHEIFQIQKTSFTNRVDDFIVFSYPFFGIIAIYFSRKGLYLFRKVFYFIAFGILFFCVMSVFDSMGKGLGSKYQDKRTRFQVYEESSKVIAEGFFVITALYCLKVSEKLRSGHRPKF